MLKLFGNFKDASRETKMFFFHIAIYLIIIWGIFFFAFLRLDWVRSYSSSNAPQQKDLFVPQR